MDPLALEVSESIFRLTLNFSFYSVHTLVFSWMFYFDWDYVLCFYINSLLLTVGLDFLNKLKIDASRLKCYSKLVKMFLVNSIYVACLETKARVMRDAKVLRSKTCLFLENKKIKHV